MIASDFNKHVKPVAVVPEPENEPDTDSVGDLIDTSDVSIFVAYCYRDVQLIKLNNSQMNTAWFHLIFVKKTMVL